MAITAHLIHDEIMKVAEEEATKRGWEDLTRKEKAKRLGQALLITGGGAAAGAAAGTVLKHTLMSHGKWPPMSPEAMQTARTFAQKLESVATPLRGQLFIRYLRRRV